MVVVSKWDVSELTRELIQVLEIFLSPPPDGVMHHRKAGFGVRQPVREHFVNSVQFVFSSRSFAKIAARHLCS